MDAASTLRACSLFQGFTETGVAIIAGLCASKTYPLGTPLFVENMLSDTMLVVASGTVRLSTRAPNGQQTPVGEVTTGEVLGELCLVTTSQRLCTATAATAVTAYEIRQAEFQKLMASKPQACVKLLMAICAQFAERVLASREMIKSLAGRV
jgi:CRP/FNR family cyclic AMP-dependent transcriptional regulator